MALFTNEIENILYNDRDAGKYFIGVYPSDKIPLVDRYPVGLVLNLDDSTEPGSHWVAIWIQDRNHAIYFDSYGLPPIVNNIKLFMSKYEWIYNTKPFQHAESQDCGYYAILFVLMLSKDLTLDHIQYLFYQKKNVVAKNISDKKLAKVNDMLVKDYVRFFMTRV